MDSRRLLITCCLVISTCLVGCSTMTQNKSSKKDGPFDSLKFWKKPYQTPQQVAVLWSHDVLTMPGKPPTRGFGGRMYFYNEKSQTIPVEGELIVYGYDESRRDPNQDNPQPDKTFKFTQEQFTEHFSESDLGASYSVWIPWDGADGLQKEITLIPTFRSSKGQVVQGSATKVLLPGRKVQGGPQAPTVQTVAFEERTIPTVSGMLPTGVQSSRGPQTGTTQLNGPGLQSQSGLGTTTIDLPANLQQTLVSQASKNTSAAAQPAWGPQELAAIEEARAKALAAISRHQADQFPAAQNMTAPSSANGGFDGQASQPIESRAQHGFMNMAKSNIPMSAGQRPTSATLNPAAFGHKTMNSTAFSNAASAGMNQGTVPVNVNTSLNVQPQAPPVAPNIPLPPGVELTPQAKWSGSAPAW